MKKIAAILCIILIFIPNVSFADTDIISKPRSTEEQCKQWMIDNDVEQEFIDLLPYIFKRCTEIGIDPTVVIGQSALETGYFTSYNLRKNHNTAGIKSRSNTNKYAYYESYKDGFDAQINHLALYAGIPQEGYYYSHRLDGWVTTVEGLTGTWAEDRYYANKLNSIISAIQHYEVEEIKEVEAEEIEIVEEHIEDIPIKKRPLDIIKNILSKNKKQSKAVKLLLNFIKK